MNKTKIIATINDQLQDFSLLESLYDAGVRVARFNFSHAGKDDVKKILLAIRDLSNQKGKHLATLLDTKGIEIRSGKLPEKRVFQRGEIFPIYTDEKLEMIPEKGLVIDYPYLSSDVRVGDRIEIDSGLLSVEVDHIQEGVVYVRAMSDALIGSKRHINLPGVKLRLPSLTSKDEEDLLFAIEQKMDFVAASFVRTAQNVLDIRSFLDLHGGMDIKIVSKIENQEAIENLEEIVPVSDGVMVARGDLGIEVPMTQLPLLQKRIVKLSRSYGKFVIVATHMLKSMVDSPSPTRAEVSDVFNAVMQQADMTMLSEETAIGEYKCESVRIMYDIAREAESSIEYGHKEYETISICERDHEKKQLIRSAIKLSEELGIQDIVIFTKTGRLARYAAAYRPSYAIHTLTPSMVTLRQCHSLFGIAAYLLSDWSTHDQNLWNGLKLLSHQGAIAPNARVIVVHDIIEGEEEIPTLSLLDLSRIKK